MRRSLASLILASLIATSAAALDGWRLYDTHALESEGSSWDYLHLDPTQPRLFIGNRKEGLKVFDLRTRKIKKIIQDTDQHSSNGATFVPEFDLGISNNEDGTITPFTLSTLEVKDSIRLSKEIDNSHYDPASKRLIVNVAAGESGTDLVVLELPSLKTIGTISVPTTKPEHADFDGKGTMFLAARDKDTVFRIDTKTLKVTAAWPTPGCGRTNSLVFDAASKRILLGCRGNPTTKPSFAVMDAENGKMVYSGEIGEGVDGLAFDPKTKRVFLSCGVSAVINVFEQVSADQYRPIEALGTRAGARTLAYDPENETLYSVVAEGTADFSKKITTSVSPFYANKFFKNTFKVMSFRKSPDSL